MPKRLFVSLLILACAGCARPVPTTAPATVPAADAPPWFRDATDELGIDFVHESHAANPYQMNRCLGSGLAAFDCDGDGRPDLYFLNAGAVGSKATNRLYRQKPDGKYEDISAGSGLDITGNSMGVAVGDIDDDGRPDVVVTQYGATRVFLNLGGGKFREITAESGVKNPLWGTSAAFVDYDRDGRLDLVIANYVDYDPGWNCTAPGGTPDFCSPKTFTGTSSKLFRNLGSKPGEAVRFEDVSLASGIGRLPGPGLGVTCADFDGDGWPDIFVANDGKPNRLWINRKDGTFADESVSRGVAYTYMGEAFAGMGIACGDVDNDGLLDLYVTHLTSETNTLWKQGPRGIFRDRTGEFGLKTTRWRGTGFGTVMADFDLDGFADIAVVNGRVAKGPKVQGPGLAPFWEAYGERNQLLAGDGKGFRDLSPVNPALCGDYNVARGIVCADLNGDGAPDLAFTTVEGRARVLLNVAPARGAWLAVRAIDPKWKGDAIGATVTAVCGDVRRIRSIQPAQSFLSSSSAVAQFGLGSATAVDALEVVWPDGSKETFPGGPANRSISLNRGEGRKP